MIKYDEDFTVNKANGGHDVSKGSCIRTVNSMIDIPALSLHRLTDWVLRAIIMKRYLRGEGKYLPAKVNGF